MGKLVAPEALKPHPRLNDGRLIPPIPEDEYEALRDSIARFGIKQDIVVAWPSGVILDGHHRWRAALELGVDEVSIWPEEFLSDDEALDLGVQLNANRRQWTWDQKRESALAMREEGWTLRRIAETLGVGKSTVGDWLGGVSGSGHVDLPDTITDSLGREQPATKPRTPKLASDTPRPSSTKAETEPREAAGRPVEEEPEPTAEPGVVSMGGWREDRARRAEAALDDLPEDDREAVRSIVEEPGIPDALGVDMVERVASMPPEERAEVVRLARSDDPRDRSLAKSKAAGRPPMPDPRFTILGRVLQDLAECIERCDRDPDPAMAADLSEVQRQVEALRSRLSRRKTA